MKADRSDAPDFIRTGKRKGNTKELLTAGAIGTCFTLAMLHMAGSAYLDGTLKSLANPQSQISKTAQVAEITRADTAPSKDWDRIVEEQVKRDQPASPRAIQPGQPKQVSAPAKQTTFNDANYVPRGAYNVVSYNDPPIPVETPKPPQKMKVTIVGETLSRKEQICSYTKKGSLAHRRCKAHVGLNYRD